MIILFSYTFDDWVWVKVNFLKITISILMDSLTIISTTQKRRSAQIATPTFSTPNHLKLIQLTVSILWSASYYPRGAIYIPLLVVINDQTLLFFTQNTDMLKGNPYPHPWSLPCYEKGYSNTWPQPWCKQI